MVVEVVVVGVHQELQAHQVQVVKQLHLTEIQLLGYLATQHVFMDRSLKYEIRS